MKLLKIIFFTTILSTLVGEVLRIELGNNIAFRPLEILLSVGIAAFIYLRMKNKSPTSAYLGISIKIFSILGVMSLIIGSRSLSYDQFVVSFLYWLRWVIYSMIYFIVLNLDKETHKKIIKSLFIVGVLIVIFGYLQYFMYPNLRNLFYLGWDEHNFRMFSVFLDPNFAGSFFVLFLIFVAHLLHKKMEDKRNYRISLYGFIAVGTIIAVFLTYSRSALLMLIASTITYLMVIGKKKLLFFLAAIFSIILFVLIPTFNKENTNLFRRTSSLARIESYTNAMKIIQDHPVLGVGFNAYRYAQQGYGLKEVNTDYPNHADAGVDSSLLFVWATTGVFGLIAYLYMWIKIIKLAIKKLHSDKKSLAAVLLSSVAGLFVNSLFINSLFFPYILLWIWIIVGLVEKE